MGMKMTLGVRAVNGATTQNVNVITHENPDVLTVAELRANISRNMQAMVDASIDHARMLAHPDSGMRDILRATGLDVNAFANNVDSAMNSLVSYLMRTPSFKWCDLGDVTTWPFTAGRATYQVFVEFHERGYADMHAPQPA